MVLHWNPRAWMLGLFGTQPHRGVTSAPQGSLSWDPPFWDQAGGQTMRKAATAIAYAAAPRPQATLEAGALVEVEQGLLCGEVTHGINVFKGIPYAAPPVGPLRWKAPEPPAPWSGAREALQFGPACPQPARAGGNPKLQDEDCLYLNVWAPQVVPEGGLPVMVWLHGGGFARGAGNQRRYHGLSFAREGVILVSLNYRIGPLGFFAHPALTREAGAGVPIGSYGLMDQIAALRWVQRNIGAFGGDPSRVTLFGESAGGHSVLYMMTNRHARGLFHQAIAQSAPAYTEPRSLGVAEQQGMRMAQSAGLGPRATVEQLRALPVESLFHGPKDPVPFTDGRFITETPAQAVLAGRDLPVPLIIGTNSDEGSLVKAYADGARAAIQALGSTAPALRAAYGSSASSPSEFHRQAFADVVFNAPARWIAGRHGERAPSYLYCFDYLPTALRGTLPGAPHSLDVAFVFDNLENNQVTPTHEDREMARMMHAGWVAFAKTGNPACEACPDWPAYRRSSDETMVFRPGDTRAVAGYRSKMLDLIAAKLMR